MRRTSAWDCLLPRLNQVWPIDQGREGKIRSRSDLASRSHEWNGSRLRSRRRSSVMITGALAGSRLNVATSWDGRQCCSTLRGEILGAVPRRRHGEQCGSCLRRELESGAGRNKVDCRESSRIPIFIGRRFYMGWVRDADCGKSSRVGDTGYKVARVSDASPILQSFHHWTMPSCRTTRNSDCSIAHRKL